MQSVVTVVAPPEPVAPAGHSLPTTSTAQPVDSSAKAGRVTTGVEREGSQGDSYSESEAEQDEEGVQQRYWQALAEAVGGVGSGLGQLVQSEEAEVQTDGSFRSGVDAAAAAGVAGTAAVMTAVSAADTAAAAAAEGTAGAAGEALAAIPPAGSVVALAVQALPVIALGADTGAAAVAAGVQ